MKKANRKIYLEKESAITLIALVVTIVVLLILAGVSITVLFGEHGIFKTTENATTKFGVEAEKEKIENVRIDWYTKKVTGQNVTVEDFWKMLKKAEIIDNREDDVIGPDNNNTYIVETNSGYTVEIIVDEKGNIQIGDIKKGKLGSKIRNLEVSQTTKTSINVKAEVIRAEKAIIEYFYKSSEDISEESYIKIDNIINDEAIITGLIEGKSYDIKAVLKEENNKIDEKTITVIAGEQILQINLDKSQVYMLEGGTTTLNATILPEDAILKTLEWDSSDEEIVIVDNNGKVTAKKEGIAQIIVKTTDGSKKEAVCKIEVEKLVADGSFSEKKGVNTPKLGTGMSPITWNESANNGEGDWVYPTSIDDWYEYTSNIKKWANAVTEDGSMWVWIPRYAYQISSEYHTNAPNGGTINIKFMKGTSNIAADGKEDWNNQSGMGNWNIHPGFEYDVTKPGIWVAKFEASHEDASSSSEGTSGKLKIVPKVKSWRNIWMDTAYDTCLKYNSNLNSHLIKNSEWGACAYLSQSDYGKASKIECNDVGTTGGEYGQIYKEGINQSTTGNAYGIYDMSGGLAELVAAYLYVENYGLTNQYDCSKSLIQGESYTKNVYNSIETTQAEYYNNMSNIYGEAIYETSLQGDFTIDKTTGDRIGYAWYGEFSLGYVYRERNNDKTEIFIKEIHLLEFLPLEQLVGVVVMK